MLWSQFRKMSFKANGLDMVWVFVLPAMKENVAVCHVRYCNKQLWFLKVVCSWRTGGDKHCQTKSNRRFWKWRFKGKFSLRYHCSYIRANFKVTSGRTVASVNVQVCRLMYSNTKNATLSDSSRLSFGSDQVGKSYSRWSIQCQTGNTQPGRIE